MEKPDVNRADFWQSIYDAEPLPGWDLGEPAPPFVKFVERDQKLDRGKLAVIGCGMGNDALFFAENGFDVTAIDFAPSAISAVKKRAAEKNVKITAIEQSIFDLPKTHANFFDYVVEHTCFCAIDPDRRIEYAQMIKQILKSDGKLIAIFYAIPPDEGPPFGTTETEIRQLFEIDFKILEIGISPHSIERRSGKEIFAVIQKKENL